GRELARGGLVPPLARPSGYAAGVSRFEVLPAIDVFGGRLARMRRGNPATLATLPGDPGGGGPVVRGRGRPMDPRAAAAPPDQGVRRSISGWTLLPTSWSPTA